MSHDWADPDGDYLPTLVYGIMRQLADLVITDLPHAIDIYIVTIEGDGSPNKPIRAVRLLPGGEVLDRHGANLRGSHLSQPETPLPT